MSNEQFKVKFGLAVGDTSMTVDAATGNTETNGLGVFKQNTTGAVTIGDGSGNGSIEIGQSNRATSGTPFIDFHSSATATDYDVRLLASGGTATAGSGQLTIEAGTTKINNALGIGIVPSYQLDVSGTGNFSSNLIATTGFTLKGATSGQSSFSQQASGSNISYSLPPSQGAANTALTNDGSGNLTWALPGGGGSTFGNVTVGVDTDQTISTTSGNLILQTAAGVNAGTITLASGTNGAITFAPNGTGTVVIPTADITNLEVTNIRALDGTAAASIANSTGVVSITTQLNVDNININGNTISSTDTNGDIIIITNGTGDIDLVADTIQVGDSNATATITTNGTGNLILNTNNGTNAGTLTLANGANGAVTLAPNGTGSVALTLANGGNLTNTRNYVQGAIRNATSAAAGEIWTFGPAGTGSKGISLDNSADTADGPATVLRGFTGGAIAGNLVRGRVVFEKARGTSASPTAIQSGDQLGSMDATGYTTTGWVADLVPAVGGTQVYSAAENWVSNTNLGTAYGLLLAPTATTISTGANLITCLAITPQAFANRSDSYSWSKGKTSTQNMMTLNDQSNKITLGVNQLRATTANETGQINFSTYRSTDGINYTPTQSGDIIGSFKFNGNANTSTSPGVPAGPGAQITATATELWSATANGTSFALNVIKKTTTTDFNVFNASSDAIRMKSTKTVIADVNDIPVLTITDTSATFAQPVGFPVKTRAQWSAITGSVGQQVCVSDSSGSSTQTEDGMMAYWGTTATAGWKYIHDNRAI